MKELEVFIALYERARNEIMTAQNDKELAAAQAKVEALKAHFDAEFMPRRPATRERSRSKRPNKEYVWTIPATLPVQSQLF
ncbi:MAG: hypothetical protein ACI4QA_02490 [Candidatus Spyradosoma sp.]